MFYREGSRQQYQALPRVNTRYKAKFHGIIAALNAQRDFRTTHRLPISPAQLRIQSIAGPCSAYQSHSRADFVTSYRACFMWVFTHFTRNTLRHLLSYELKLNRVITYVCARCATDVAFHSLNPSPPDPRMFNLLRVSPVHAASVWPVAGFTDNACVAVIMVMFFVIRSTIMTPLTLLKNK
ncbi:hypothetical protein KCP77_14895 [Salmonella enterica subsp. enterica]|nr:hypothetical protein KCP77_14895 [Salmonella enterica subsp. enterica]